VRRNTVALFGQSRKYYCDLLVTKKFIDGLKKIIRYQVENAADPTNAQIKNDLIGVIREKKAKVAVLEAELERLMNTEVSANVQLVRLKLRS
jgi:hypothetical protein